MTGRIMKLFENKNFGFIKSGNVDYFFHRDDFVGHWNDLIEDFQIEGYIDVEFEKGIISKKGPRAEQVTRVSHPNEAAREEKSG